MAMKIGRRSTLETIDIDGWRRFAADAGLGLPLVLRRLCEISAGVQARAGEVAGALTRAGTDSDVLTDLAEMVAGRDDTRGRQGGETDDFKTRISNDPWNRHGASVVPA